MILRGVVDSDLPVFFEHQRDAIANVMVGSTPQAEEEFFAHWARTSQDPGVRRLTVELAGKPAGYVGSFLRGTEREVCYWLGREAWGRGTATAALAEFLKGETARPLFARVNKRNPGSIRVLEKCGFVRAREDRFRNRAGDKIEEFVFRLDARSA